MNADRDDNKIFTAADIQRYLQGQMTPSQMHALEKAALEDPFLADAIEGYAERPWFTPDLEELRSRLKEKVEPSHKSAGIFQRWWRVAALVILLGGTGVIAYKLLSNASLQMKTALTREERSVMQDSISDPLVQSQSSNDTTAVALNESRQSKPTSPARDSRMKPVRSKPQAVLQNEFKVSPAPARSTDSNMQKPEAERNIAVTAEKTSDQGYLSPDRKAFGAVSQSPVYKQKARKAEGLLIPVQDAVPQVGYPDYNKYIEKNKRLDVLKNSVHGEVVVSFFVDIDGSLSDFKVERSQSVTLDNEAVRLIKEGPAWKVLKNQRARVDYTVKF